MASSRSFGTELTAPWQALANDASTVIAMRLAALSLQWATAPDEANREVARMVSEKQSAIAETQIAAMQAPWLFWCDVYLAAIGSMTGGRPGNPMLKANSRLIDPSRSRVKANKRRLSSGG